MLSMPITVSPSVTSISDARVHQLCHAHHIFSQIRMDAFVVIKAQIALANTVDICDYTQILSVSCI